MFERLILPVALLSAACTTTGQGSIGSAPSINPTFDAIPLDRELVDSQARQLPGYCTPGDVDLVGQRVRGSLAIELDAGDVIGLNTVSVTGGRYDFSLQTLSPLNCTPIDGVVIGPLRVDFELAYEGALADDGGEQCVYASQLEFTRFDLFGIELLDAVVESTVRANILAEVDRAHAEALNFAPLAAGSDGRCVDWSPLE